MSVIALDLGGTKLTGALVTPLGRILYPERAELGDRRGPAVGLLVRETTSRLLKRAQAQGIDITGIGVAVPGISYGKTGRVWAPNIPGWKDYPLLRDIRAVVPKPGMRLMMASDRSCYILGETWRGAARGTRDAIFLAVGTGIGAGIMTGGRLLHGVGDIAGSLGWLALQRPFRSEYGCYGCFEYYASGEGLARAAAAQRRNRRSGEPPWSARDVFAAWGRGERVGKAVVQQAIELWGMAVANLVSTFNPEVIVFGGGVFGPAAKCLPQIYREAKKWAQPVAMGQVRLRVSKLGGNAGLMGAARLALQPEADS